MASTTIRFDTFTGISRLKSRTILEPNELWEAKGVIADERGRLKSCWESGIKYEVDSNVFTYESPFSAPEQAREFKNSLVISNKSAVYNIDEDNLYVPTNTAAATLYERFGFFNNGVGIFRDASNPSITISYSIGDVVISRDDPRKKYYIINSSSGIDPYTIPELPPIGLNESEYYYIIKHSAGIQMVEYGGFLIICRDGAPALAIDKKDAYKAYQQVYGYPQHAEVAGVHFFSAWKEATGTYFNGAIPERISFKDLDGVAIDFSNDIEITGYNGTLPSKYENYRPFITIFKDNSQSSAIDTDIYGAGKRYAPGGVIDPDEIELATSFPEEPSLYIHRARIGKLAHRLALRHPVVYRGRFCAFEGRYLSEPLGGGFNGGSSTKGTYVPSGSDMPNGGVNFVGANISDVVGKADVLVVYEDSPIDADWQIKVGGSDYQAFAVKTFYNSSVFENGGQGTCARFLPNQNYDLSATNNLMCHFHRILTAEERRTLYFFGRPADTANGISRDDTDFLFFDPLNSVIIGEDEDGDIKAAISDADNRIIVGLESAIYQVTGDPPVAGIPGRGFNVQKLAGGIGIYSDTSYAWDETGQIVYFCNSIDKGIYAIYGNAVDRNRLDIAITNHPAHPANRETGFSHLVVSNGRLYCQTDEEFPVIWIYDFRTQSWTYTERKTNIYDPNTQTYTTKYFVDPQRTGWNAGGLFRPFKDGGQSLVTNLNDDLYVWAAEELIAPNYEYGLARLNHPSDYTLDANFRHGCKIESPLFDADMESPKKIRQIRILCSEPNISDGTNVQKALEVSVTNSEGDTVLTRTVDPEWENTDTYKYRIQGTGSRGDTAVGLSINETNEGIIPELDSIEVDIVALPHRKR